MARIVLDPDEVNQDQVVTLTDGTVVTLAEADAATLRRVAQQLHVHRSSYWNAYEAPDSGVGRRIAEGEVTIEDIAPLHVRVRALLAQRKQAGRGADQVDLGALLQDRVWTSSSGVTTELRAMTPSHRANLLDWLERNSEALHDRVVAMGIPAEALAVVREADPWVAGTPIHRRLRQLQEEASGLELAKDAARQVVRRAEYERTGKWPTR